MDSNIYEFLNSRTIRRLQERASADTLSVDDLINKLLDQPDHQPRDHRSTTPSVLVTEASGDQPIVYVNSEFTHMTGYRAEEVIGRNSRFLQGDDHDQPDLETLHEAINEGKPVTVTIRNYRKDGTLFWNHMDIIPVYNANGDLTHFIGMQNDVTDQMGLQMPISDIYERYRLLIEHSRESLALHAPDGRFLFVTSSKFPGGYSQEELLAMGPEELAMLVHPDDQVRAFQAHHQALESAEPLALEYRILLRDGSYRWIETNSKAIRDTAGNIVYIVATTRDISARKAAEEALCTSESRLRYLLNNTPAVIFTARPDGDHGATFVSENVCEITGYSPEAFTSDSTFWGSKLHPDDAPGVYALISQIPETGHSIQEYRYLCADGTYKWMRAEIQLTYDEEGQPVELIGYWLDISDRKKIDEALQASQEFINGILRAAPAFIYVYDFVENRNAFANEGLTRILGYTPAELQAIGSNAIPRLIHPDDQQRVLAKIEDIKTNLKDDDVYQGHYRLRHRNGHWIWILDQGTVFKRSESGEVLQILGSVIDISEQIMAREALRESETRLRSLVDSQTAFVVRTDLEGHFTYVNTAWKKSFGWLSDNIIGRPSFESILPEDHTRTLETVVACMANPGQPVQAVLRKPAPNDGVLWTLWEFVAVVDADGNPTEIQCVGFDITELTQARQQAQLQESALLAAANAIVITDRDANIQWVNPAFTRLTGYTLEEAYGKNPNILVKSSEHDQAFYQEMWDTILSGNVWVGKLVNRRKDGSRYVEEQTITPVYDNNGEISHFIAIKQDVTDRERTQRFMLDHERLKERFRKEEEQNALIQRTISALSHDLRTPLAVIASSRDILSRYFDQISEERRQEKLDGIGRQLQFALELLDDMVLVVKGNLNHRSFHPAPMNLDVLCRVSIDEIRDTNDTRHRFIYSNPDDIQVVSVDEILVSRILLNLLSNAVKYSEDKSETRLLIQLDSDHVILVVSDQGIGISEDELPHIFDPFFRAANAKHIGGTGLGLSIVKDCVERHRGSIEVYSQPGEGTTFRVRLPLIERRPPELQND